MKDFWKDYGELCKSSGRFYKKHWKGLLVLNAAIIGVEFAFAWAKSKTKQFDNLISKKHEDEEAQ